MNEVIPSLILNKKQGKVKILDVGAGVGFFTEQIRKKFPDEVEVFSTGLSKKSARDYRKSEKNVNFAKNLHPQDLKWRTILELSDFEEFDLIIDTFGEQANLIYKKDAVKSFEKYLRAVLAKLKKGGWASIYPIHILDESQYKTETEEIISRLGKEHKVQITIFQDPDSDDIFRRMPLMRIVKP